MSAATSQNQGHKLLDEGENVMRWCLKCGYETTFHDMFNHSVTNVTEQHDNCRIENDEGKG